MFCMKSCGDIEEGKVVELCECLNLRESGRPHGFKKETGTLEVPCQLCGALMKHHIVISQKDWHAGALICPGPGIVA